MQTVSAPYTLETAKRSQAPAYLARLFHVTKAGKAAEFPFSRDLTTFQVLGTNRPQLACLRTPAGNTQTIDTENGRSSVGTFTFALVDLLGEVSRYMANPACTLATALPNDNTALTVSVNEDIAGYPALGTLVVGLARERIRYTSRNPATKTFSGITRGVDNSTRIAQPVGTAVGNGEQIRAGQRIQLYAGYQNLAFDDWASFARMEITSTASDSAAGYTIQTADVQRFMRQFMLLTATQEAPIPFAGNPIDVLLTWLMASGTAAQSTGTVQAVSPNTLTGVGTAFLSFLRPGDYVGVGVGTTSFQVLQVAAVASDTSLTTVTPVTATAAGLSYLRAGDNGKYDVMDGTNGLALPASFVDTAGIEALRTSDFAGQIYEYLLSAPVEGKSFIESELKTMNCYPVVLRDGRWSLRRYKPVVPGVTVAVAGLTEDDILSWSWGGGEERIINVAEFQYDWNLPAAADDYTTRQRYKALDSIDKFGARPAFKISALGIRSTLGGQAMVDDRAFQLFKRFSDPPAVLQVALRYGRHLLEPGDIVSVTHRLIPNRATGVRGLAGGLFEIRDIRPAFGATAGQSGLVMTLLDVGNQVIPQVPVSDGTENNLQTLLVNRAAFYDVTAIAVSATGLEVQTASVTVTLQRDTDSILINARQSIQATLPNPTDYTTSRIRLTSIAGTLLDGISPPSFAVSSGKSVSASSLGVVAHDILYSPATTGPVTVIMSVIPSASGAGGTASSRSLTVTVRSR
jgi:hypothetical protein